MKIEIEFDNSYSAKLTIDGRELRVECRKGVVHLDGIKSPESDETLGGLIAIEMFGFVSRIQQAWLLVDGADEKTWSTLVEDLADEVRSLLS